MNKSEIEWQTYRSRFLIQAKQLAGALVFVDALGREHRGKKGDYLVESANGARRIWPRQLFEDAHVLLNSPSSSDVSLPVEPTGSSGSSESPKKMAVEKSRYPSVNKGRSSLAPQPLIA